MAKFDMNAFVATQTAAAIKASASGSKGVNGYVASALRDYRKAGVKLHLAACVTLFHAAEFGDVRMLNTFFEGLRQNDMDALRVWVGKLVTFEVLDETTGETSDRKFLAFKKDKGFVCVKGTEAVRVGFFKLENLMAGRSFQDVDQDQEKGAIGLAELLAMLAKVERSTKKKAEENGVELPASIKALLHDITGTVAKVTNQIAPAAGNLQ